MRKEVIKKTHPWEFYRFETLAPMLANLLPRGKSEQCSRNVEVAKNSKSEKFDGLDRVVRSLIKVHF
jgi:hypothetical protein